MSRARTRGKPKYPSWQRVRLHPGIVGRLGETRSKSVALESKACRRGESSAKIFGDFNQEVRKTGEDQELFEIHSIALLRDAR
jgi:hypothetical protein